MKRLTMCILVLCFMFSASLVLADVVGEIIAIDKDANGNIRVWSQYKIDGVEVESRYPKIDGKQVYCSRYQVLNFAGMSDAEIKTRILADVNRHAETLIQKTFIEKANEDIYTSHLKDVNGSKVSKTTTDIKVDTDRDGEIDETWTLKIDGTHTVAVITL